MPIPTVAKWQKDTSSVLHARNNSLILDIDTLLGEYHANGKTDVQKQKILILMLYICTEWLVIKKGSNWRRTYVKDLIGNIEAELRTQAMTQATQDRLSGRPGISMKENPIELLQPKDATRIKLNLTGPSHLNRASAGDATGFVSSWGQRGDLKGHLKKLQGITINDYVDELKILAAGNAADLLKKDLAYLSKTDRVNKKLICQGNGIFHLSGSDQPYSSPQGCGDLFVMDNLELLYVSQDKAAGKFHHSSFFSGRPVLCAGEMMLASGVITFISNTSGHYRPSLQDLLNCLTILRDKCSCDLARIKVEVVTSSKWKTDRWSSADEFLKCRGVRQSALVQGREEI